MPEELSPDTEPDADPAETDLENVHLDDAELDAVLEALLLVVDGRGISASTVVACSTPPTLPLIDRSAPRADAARRRVLKEQDPANMPR